MSTLIQFPLAAENIAGYRFGHAELLLASERLLVSGAEVPLSPMAYRFLLALCRSRGALLSRAEAFDLLWPGGGSGSDEALAQIVLKVRQALGAEGRAIATVRGRGFRLELPIESLPLKPLSAVASDESRSAPSTPESAVDASATPLLHRPDVIAAVSKEPSLLRWLALVAVVLALLAWIALTRFASAPDLALDGYALDASAFGPISAQGAKAVQTALQREDEGDRSAARQLAQALIDSEAQSAAPAFFLTFWQSGNAQDAAHWRQLLKQRLPLDAPVYLQLLARWVAIEGNQPGVENELLSTALKLQPSAWRLHLARAHVALRLLRFDQALADLRAVPLARLSPRFAMFVMSDRADLGDAAAMRAELPALTQRAPLLAESVRGRIALAQGQWQPAQAAFESTAEQAEQETLIGALSHTWLYAAVAAGAQQHWQDLQHDAEQARRIGSEHALDLLVADAEMLIGYAQFRRALADQADASWARAEATTRNTHDSAAAIRLWLQRARLQPAWAAQHAAPEAGDSSLPAGLGALLDARQAWLGCADAAARQALIAAESAGLDTSYFADELDLLRQDLGLARHAAAAPPALPYPALTRWITFWESTRSAGRRSCDGATAAIKAAGAR